MLASKVTSFKTNFFRMAGALAAETSVSEKAECLFAKGEDKNTLSFLFLLFLFLF